MSESEIVRTPEEIEAEIAKLQAEEAALKSEPAVEPVVEPIVESAAPTEPPVVEVAPEEPIVEVAAEIAPDAPVVVEPEHKPAPHIIRPAGQTVAASWPLQPLHR